MSKHYRFHSPSVGALVTATAAALQGIDRLPPEDRSSQTALTLLDYVLRQMREGTPDLRPNDWQEIDKLRAQLQAAIEGEQMWAGFPSLEGLVH